MRDQIRVLTPFVLAVAHERLLHGLGRLNSVLLLDGYGVGGRDDGLRDDLQRLDHADVTKLLRDVQSSLSVLRRDISYNESSVCDVQQKKGIPLRRSVKTKCKFKYMC